MPENNGVQYSNPPQSRNEAILESIVEGTEYTDPPQSRIEDLLLQIKEKGGTGTEVEANPTLVGTETALDGIKIGSTKYSVGLNDATHTKDEIFFTDSETSEVKKLTVANGKALVVDPSTESQITTYDTVEIENVNFQLINSSGSAIPSNVQIASSEYSSGITDYIDIEGATEVVISAFARNTQKMITYALYNSSKEMIYVGCPTNDGVAVSASDKFIKDYVTHKSVNAKYIRVAFWINSAITWTHPYVKVVVGGGSIQTIHFTQKINKYVASDDGNSLSAQDGYTEYTDTGVLFLPKTYKADGKKTRLVIVCHGSGTVIDNNFVLNTKNYVETLVKSGYAVLDVNGGVSDGRHFGAPFAIQSYVKAYEWAVANYNLTKEVFIYGASMGGLTSFSLAECGAIPVKAQAGVCPVTDLFRQAWMYPWYSVNTQGTDFSIQRERIAEYFNFTDYAQYESGTERTATATDMQYFIDNVDKVKGYDPMIKGSTNADGIFTTATSDYASLYTNIAKLHKVPVKIWHASNDETVKAEFSQYIVNAIKKAGCEAHYRQFPSGGHTPDLGNTITMTDTDGNGFTSYVATYEVVQWFKRWE